MMQADDLTARAAALQKKVRDVHGIRGRDLAHSLRRARRVLPRHLRTASEDIAAAQALQGHPKLEPMIDLVRLSGLFRALHIALDAVNVAERRKTQMIRGAARIAGYVLFVIAAFIVWMVWAGHL